MAHKRAIFNIYEIYYWTKQSRQIWTWSYWDDTAAAADDKTMETSDVLNAVKC